MDQSSAFRISACRHCVLLGAAVAKARIDAAEARFQPVVVGAMLTVVLLQVLANFANDYGDFKEQTPLRAAQTVRIWCTPRQRHEKPDRDRLLGLGHGHFTLDRPVPGAIQGTEGAFAGPTWPYSLGVPSRPPSSILWKTSLWISGAWRCLCAFFDWLASWVRGVDSPQRAPTWVLPSRFPAPWGSPSSTSTTTTN